jgi:sulfur transfer protein SufE
MTRDTTTLDAIRADFALLDDWEDRYRYVIELGRGLPALPEALRNEANRVRGCVSQVWLASATREGPHGRVFAFKFPTGMADPQRMKRVLGCHRRRQRGRPFFGAG